MSSTRTGSRLFACGIFPVANTSWYFTHSCFNCRTCCNVKAPPGDTPINPEASISVCVAHDPHLMSFNE